MRRWSESMAGLIDGRASRGAAVAGLDIRVFDSETALAAAAADDVAARLKELLARQDDATVMFATGTSQVSFLGELVRRPGIDWGRVGMCHLDEYVGLPPDHRAGFVNYLRGRVIDRLPFKSCTLIDGMAADPDAECIRLAGVMRDRPLDIALVGIGENGHLAFNDPPADFETTAPYIVVELDDACRRQQVGEGWFSDVAAVPERAISASINFILSAGWISCIVSGRRKMEAVRRCFTGDISPLAPASALRRHTDTVVWLDRHAAALLDRG